MPDVIGLVNERCVVILSGGMPPFNIKEDDMVICADSGILPFEREERLPDILIGDMDSLPDHFIEKMRVKGVKVEKYPEDKDLSDGELAIKRAITFSPDLIEIYGGKTGRIDHVLSCFHLLHRIPHGIQSVLTLDEDQVILIREGDTHQGRTLKSVISVLPAFRKARVTLRGLKWQLEDHPIEIGSTLGIHNEYMGRPFQVKAESGDIYLILADEGSPE